MICLPGLIIYRKVFHRKRSSSSRFAHLWKPVDLLLKMLLKPLMTPHNKWSGESGLGESGPGLSPGQGHCVVFLFKTLNSRSASLHPDVQMSTSELSIILTYRMYMLGSETKSTEDQARETYWNTHLNSLNITSLTCHYSKYLTMLLLLVVTGCGNTMLKCLIYTFCLSCRDKKLLWSKSW